MELTNFPFQMNFEEYLHFKKLVEIWQNSVIQKFRNGMFAHCGTYLALYTTHDHLLRLYANSVLKLSLHLHSQDHINTILQHPNRNFKIKYEERGTFIPPEKVFEVS